MYVPNRKFIQLKSGRAYCHYEEAWRPIELFDDMVVTNQYGKKVNHGILRAVCNECVKSKHTLDKKYPESKHQNKLYKIYNDN